MLLWASQLTENHLLASDYVDDINRAANNEVGHQVIYELNVGSFTAEGTFAAAQQKLADLKALGVDIVWFMPIYPRGGGINSPYAATDFQQTNPKYGTIADLRSLVDAAHALNMQVWLDWVPNHTATNASWVTTHPEYYAKSGGQMIHPNGYNDVWQLDYNNTTLVNAMNDCLKFWIDQADIDGYRCDYISSSRIPASYWQTAIPLIKNYKSGKTITVLGEGDIAQDVTRLKTVGFDYDYAWAYQSSLANLCLGLSEQPRQLWQHRRLFRFAEGQCQHHAQRLCQHLLQSHAICHQPRSELQREQEDTHAEIWQQPLFLAYTLYGMPLIYNGQEVGGNQALDYFNDTKINWSSPDTKMLNTIRTLTALKHVVPALGDKVAVNWVTLSSGAANVLAFTRQQGDSEVLVVLNMATTATNATLTGLTAGDWSLWLTSETISQGVSRKQQMLSATQSITVDAKGYRVYVRGTFPEEDIPTTGIKPLSVDGSALSAQSSQFYDLSGRPVSTPTRPGLYIRGGKKVVVPTSY